MKKAYYALTFGLIFLAMFVKFNHVDISHCSVESKKFSKEHIALPFSHTSFGNEIYTYTCRLDSLFEQTSKIGIAVDEKLLSVKINGEDVDLDRIKKQYGQKQLKDWQRGYFFSIPLLKGDNTLHFCYLYFLSSRLSLAYIPCFLAILSKRSGISALWI